MAFTAYTIRNKGEKRFAETLNRSSQIINYGWDDLYRNDYPQRTRETLEASPTGVACANIFANFIEGRGFENESFYKAIINRKGQTVDQVLRLLSRDYSRHGYFALHVGYNLLYEIDSLTRIDPRYVRIGLPDSDEFSSKIAIYNDWAKDNYKVIKRKKIDYLDTFAPDFAQLQKEAANAGGEHWQGQCFLYTGEEQAYVKCPHDPVLVQMETEALIAKGRRAKFKQGTSIKHLLMFPHELPEEARLLAQQRLQQMQGPEGDVIGVLEGVAFTETSGQKVMPQMVAIDHTKGPEEMHSIDAQDVRREIIRAYNQPTILHSEFKDSGLSSADQVENAFNFYNQITIRARRVMEETFAKLIPLFKYDINPSGDYSIMPLQFGEDKNEEENAELPNTSE